MAGKILRAALGQRAVVGDLYDARSDHFCGANILKQEPISTELHNIESSSVQILLTDTMEEKFSKLNVTPEQNLSVLAGLVALEGSGKFLQDSKISAYLIRKTLHYFIHTKLEKLNLFDKAFKEMIWIDSLKSENATHVVVEVSWGANTFITAESMNIFSSYEAQDIERVLQIQLNTLSTAIITRDNTEINQELNQNLPKFSFNIFGDVLPEGKDCHQTIADVSDTIKKILSLVHQVNNGKGKPLWYTMMPVAAIREHLKLNQPTNPTIRPVNQHVILNYQAVFEDILLVKQYLHDLHTDMKAHDYCVREDDIEQVALHKKKILNSEKNLRSHLLLTLVPVRSGKAEETRLEDILASYKACDMSSKDTMIWYALIREKVTLAMALRRQGVQYIGRNGSVDKIIAQSSSTEVYILYYSDVIKANNPKLWATTWEMFSSLSSKNSASDEVLKDNKQVIYNYIHKPLKMTSRKQGEHNSGKHTLEKGRSKVLAFVDLSIRTDLEQQMIMKHYRDGKVISHDCVTDYETATFCIAKSSNMPEHYDLKPKKLVNLEIHCPCSCNQPCELAVYAWGCFKCKQTLQYGFDDYLYCLCGRLHYQTLSFKCTSSFHGLPFLNYESNVLEKLIKSLKLPKEINILILGETGVGKSTWINGFVNYLTYPTLEDAEQGDSVDLIPASFTMTNEDYEEIEIHTGTDKNENNVAGQSATQQCKSYVITEGDRNVRLIDTPGIGDTRGIDKDKENFQNILSHLSHIENIHGVCILLKPNNARLTVMFQFCIKELLTHLHRDASRNIIFCFTNARSTFYKPGDTLPALRMLLKENKEVDIPLVKNTIYCVDNEAVRFLAALKYGQKFDDGTRQNYSASWEKSVEEIDRLIRHVESLEPHGTRSTLSLNEARRVIVAMTEPLARIGKNIDDNIAVVREKQEELSSCKLRKKKLVNKLYVPVIDLEPVHLQYPKTVCTSAKCTKIYKINGKIKTDYVKKCHDHCYLDNVTVEKYPCPELKNCNAIIAFRGNYSCRVCGCPWDTHMHITYECKQVEVQMTDETVQKLISGKIDCIKAVEETKCKLEERIQTLKEEHKFVIQASSKFAHFLRNNAITPYNDIMEEYFQLLIRQEKDKVSLGADRHALESYERMLTSHKYEVEALKQAMKQCTITDDDIICPDDISCLASSLYALPLSGKSFQGLMQVIDSAMTRNVAHNEVQVPRPISASKSNHNILHRGFYATCRFICGKARFKSEPTCYY